MFEKFEQFESNKNYMNWLKIYGFPWKYIRDALGFVY